MDCELLKAQASGQQLVPNMLDMLRTYTPWVIPRPRSAGLFSCASCVCGCALAVAFVYHELIKWPRAF